ncbi:hypothetical protein CC2G_004561 [Coprinopsis cinerea AmutBmut pab1-1]|nr:hypothetical protein CC2G_004561 [Coprinopsis cinerea AmutBmut pab1-1]
MFRSPTVLIAEGIWVGSTTIPRGHCRDWHVPDSDDVALDAAATQYHYVFSVDHQSRGIVPSKAFLPTVSGSDVSLTPPTSVYLVKPRSSQLVGHIELNPFSKRSEAFDQGQCHLSEWFGAECALASLGKPPINLQSAVAPPKSEFPRHLVTDDRDCLGDNNLR